MKHDHPVLWESTLRHFLAELPTHAHAPRMVVVEGLGEMFEVSPAMRTALVRLQGHRIPRAALVLRLVEPPETPALEPPVVCAPHGGGGGPEMPHMRFDGADMPPWGAHFDDRCAVCEHPSECHDGQGKCFWCPAARRCRRFVVKSPGDK